MSGFNKIAQSLISQRLAPPVQNIRRTDQLEEKLDHIKLLNESGFSPREIFRDLRDLADECTDEEKGIKKQILELMIKVHGMMNIDEVAKVAPIFQLIISGDNARVNTMLCPAAPLHNE